MIFWWFLAPHRFMDDNMGRAWSQMILSFCNWPRTWCPMVFFQTLKLQTPFLKPKMNHQRAMIFVDTSLIPLNTRKKRNRETWEASECFPSDLLFGFWLGWLTHLDNFWWKSYNTHTWKPNGPLDFDWSLGLVWGGWSSKIEVIPALGTCILFA